MARRFCWVKTLIFLAIAFGSCMIIQAQNSSPREHSWQQSVDKILSDLGIANGLSPAAGKALVIGEVLMPQLLVLPDDRPIFLTEAIAKIGGVLITAGHRVYLIRQNSGGKAIKREIDLREIKKGRTKDVILEKGDVVLVPRVGADGEILLPKKLSIPPPTIIDSPIPFPKKRITTDS
jgi:hypothetical protein